MIEKRSTRALRISRVAITSSVEALVRSSIQNDNATIPNKAARPTRVNSAVARMRVSLETGTLLYSLRDRQFAPAVSIICYFKSVI